MKLALGERDRGARGDRHFAAVRRGWGGPSTTGPYVQAVLLSLPALLSMMRRSFHNAVRLFCVLAQLAVGALSPAGLVFCTAGDHAAIESSSNNCCLTRPAEAHRSAGPSLERSCCCSDTPLETLACSLVDSSRSQPIPPLGLVAATPPPLPSFVQTLSGSVLLDRDGRSALRSTILRV